MPTLIWNKVKDGLDPSVKKKAYAFLEKLQESDESAGLHIEPIRGSVDPRVRTGRVDDNYRCVMFKLVGDGDPVYLIHGIWKHDVANRIAEQVTLSTNPINGVAEVKRVMGVLREQAAAPVASTVPSLAEQAHPAASTVTTVDNTEAEQAPVAAPRSAFAKAPNWAKGVTVESMHNELGLDLDLAREALTAATEDELIENVIANAAVEWQADALLELATGTRIADLRARFRLDETAAAMADAPAAETDEDARILRSLQTPAAQSSFHWIEGNDDLRRVIEAGDLGTWRLFLHPDQRTYAESDRKGTFRLSGGAGTGKTVVAVHRARHLAQAHPQARILLTTFTRNLAEDLATAVTRLDDSIRLQTKLGQPGIHARGVDQVAWSVVQRAGASITDAAEQVLGVARTEVLGNTKPNAWAEAIDEAGTGLPPELATQAFLEAEYRQVVLPNRITTGVAYVRVRRSGRGVALGKAQRMAVWKVFEAYRSAAVRNGTTDFTEKAELAAAWLEAQAERPFDHVIVDEAQDLTASQLTMLRSLVLEGSNDLFICEDSHQRIYGQKVTLGHCGINVRGGRSRRLTLNYRTTAQNLGWAMGILSGAQWSDLEGEAEEHAYTSARTGPVPLLVPASTFTEELDRAAAIIKAWLPDPQLSAAENRAAGRAAAPEDIAILVRDSYRRNNLVAALSERQIQVRSVDRDVPGKGSPLAMTMHRAKGLEFTHVLLFGLEEGAVPRSLKDYDTSETDRADALLRERSLVYVAATRARDVLAITWAGKKSEILDPTVDGDA